MTAEIIFRKGRFYLIGRFDVYRCENGKTRQRRGWRSVRMKPYREGRPTGVMEDIDVATVARALTAAEAHECFDAERREREGYELADAMGFNGSAP